MASSEEICWEWATNAERPSLLQDLCETVHVSTSICMATCSNIHRGCVTGLWSVSEVASRWLSRLKPTGVT